MLLLRLGVGGLGGWGVKGWRGTVPWSRVGALVSALRYAAHIIAHRYVFLNILSQWEFQAPGIQECGNFRPRDHVGSIPRANNQRPPRELKTHCASRHPPASGWARPATSPPPGPPPRNQHIKQRPTPFRLKPFTALPVIRRPSVKEGSGV